MSRRLQFLLLCAAVLCVSLGAKFHLVHHHGSDVPYMDQWDAEAERLYLPWFHHDLKFSDWIEPHNEHRIVLTRALVLGLLAANHQWDPLLQMTANALVHALGALGLLLLARRLLAGWPLAAVAALIALLLALPFAWENTLGGFQSQFYFLLLCGVAHFLLCLAQPAAGFLWWLGWLAGLVGLGSMSSGFLAPVVVAGVIGLRCWLARRVTPREIVALAATGALVIAGALLLTHFAPHDELKAASPLEFLGALLKGLGWPANAFLGLAFFLQAPLALWLWRRWRTRTLSTADSLLAALGLWYWLQAVAIAYARGHVALGDAPRYYDLHLIGVVAGALALFRLVEENAFRRPVTLALAAAWTLCLAAGLWYHTARTFEEFIGPGDYTRIQERDHLRRFVLTGDVAAFNAAPDGDLPHPSKEGMMRWLSDPLLRRILPTGLRAPVALRPSTDPAQNFARQPAPATFRSAAGEFVWRSTGPSAAFTSQPLPSGLLPVLVWQVNPSLRLPGSALQLRSSSGATDAARVAFPGEGWRTIRLPRTDDATVVHAELDGRGSLAFTEPVEMGRLSWVALSLRRQSLWFIVAGLACFLGAIVPVPRLTLPRICWPHVALFSVVAVLLWFANVNADHAAAPTAALDPSWQAALGDAHLQHRQFGEDFIFTYGPLGWMTMGYVLPETLDGKFAWETFGKLAFAVTLVALFFHLPRVRFLLLAVLFGAFAIFFEDVATVFLALVPLLWLIRAEARPWQRALAVAWAAFFALVKFTFFLQAGLALGVAAVALALVGRWRTGVAQLAGFALALAALWVAAGQRLSAFPAYVQMSREITTGYEATMGLEGSTPIILLAATIMLLNAVIAWRLWRDAKERAVAACALFYLCANLFVIWKHGVVRADSHVWGLFLSTLLVGVAVPAIFAPTRRLSWLDLAPALSLAGLLAVNATDTARLPRIMAARWQSVPEFLVHPDRLRDRYAASWAQQSRDTSMPDLRERVGFGTVDLLNCEQGYLFLNQLRYQPRPIPQGYSTYTPKLIEKNARFFESARAPDFVVIRHHSIDNRPNIADDGLALGVIARRYRVVGVNFDYALLQRKAVPLAPAAPELFATHRPHWGDEIKLPEPRDAAVWLEATIEPTLLGRVWSFLLRPRPLRLVVTGTDNKETAHRLLPSLTHTGFFIQPFAENYTEYAALVAGEGTHLAKWFRLELEHPRDAWLWQRPQVRLSICRDLPQNPPLPYDDLVFDGIFNRRPSRIESPNAIEPFWLRDRTALMVHAPGHVTLPLAGERRLTGHFGFREGAFEQPGRSDGAEFVAEAEFADGRTAVVWQRLLDPHARVADRGWLDFSADLPAGAVRLHLRTLPGPRQRGDWDWTYWGNIRLLP